MTKTTLKNKTKELLIKVNNSKIVADKRYKKIIERYNKLNNVAEIDKFTTLITEFNVSKETIYRALKKFPDIHQKRKAYISTGRYLLSPLQLKKIDKFLKIVSIIPDKFIEINKLCAKFNISIGTYYKIKKNKEIELGEKLKD